MDWNESLLYTVDFFSFSLYQNSDESIRELSTELVVDMGMATPQPSWIIVPLLAACNFRFIPVVYRGIFAMASAVAYRIPAHMVLENENALNHFVLHALELKGMEEADE